MRSLFEEVLSRFRGDDLRDVYAGFDAVPYRTKPRGLITVISEETVQIDAPFPGEDAGIYPFEAVFKVSVLNPMSMPLCRVRSSRLKRTGRWNAWCWRGHSA